MKYFTHRKIADGLYAITDAAMTTMYLLVGSRKAVLMDTGIGLGDIYQYVRTITNLPLIVLITHGHVDHAMGSGTFPEVVPVYMSPLDEYIYGPHQNLELRRSYLKQMTEMIPWKRKGFHEDPSDWKQPKPFDEMLPLRIGDTFDIGGEVVEVCEGAGHTCGSLTFLLENHRMLLTGDACNSGTFLFDDYSLTVAEYRASMKRLYDQTHGRYDSTLLCHGMGPMLVQKNAAMVPGAIRLCDLILAGKDRKVLRMQVGNRVSYGAKKFMSREDIGDHSPCNIFYDPVRLRPIVSYAKK